jgi:hypothetical protein
MDSFEKLKQYYLVFGLDDIIDIYMNLIGTIEGEFKLEDLLEVQTKTLEVIKYFLESELFEVGCLGGGGALVIPWNITIEESLVRIKEMWDSAGSDLTQLIWFICLDLTPKGQKIAISILLNEINVKEQVLIKGKERLISIQDIISIIKNEFHTIDSVEIKYRTLDAIRLLIDNTVLMEVGSLEEGNFVPWQYDSETRQERI